MEVLARRAPQRIHRVDVSGRREMAPGGGQSQGQIATHAALTGLIDETTLWPNGRSGRVRDAMSRSDSLAVADRRGDANLPDEEVRRQWMCSLCGRDQRLVEDEQLIVCRRLDGFQVND